MSKYNIVRAEDVADMKINSVERILSTLYEAVKIRVMPCVLNTVKNIPEDFIEELKEAGYRVEITPWNLEEDQWRIYWDFMTYRTKEKDQEDAYLDRFSL